MPESARVRVDPFGLVFQGVYEYLRVGFGGDVLR
jgi:hypothetical protein